MKPEEIETYKENRKIYLIGYTSTSKSLECALNFAFENLKDGFEPVVYEIIFKGKSGLFELTEEFTAFPGENEVLV